MNQYQEKLKQISLQLIQSQGVRAEMEAASRLAQFYQDLHAPAGIQITKTNESALDGGLALSTYDAAICVNEFLRTTRFIKGVHQALQELQTRFPGQKIKVLYAGCGPYATLVLPVLPLLDLQQFDMTFLDLHTASLHCVKSVLQLVFDTLPVQLVEGDALNYQSPAPVHLVVTETMFSALNREPQVGITKNLAPQLVPGGILVPEEISIDLVYTFVAREPFFSSEKQAALPHLNAHSSRKKIDRLFSINREPEFFQNATQNKFLSKKYTLTGDLSASPDICLFTEIRIFNDQYLGCAESSITNPVGIRSGQDMGEGASFQLEYHFDQIPRWEIKNPC